MSVVSKNVCMFKLFHILCKQSNQHTKMWFSWGWASAIWLILVYHYQTKESWVHANMGHSESRKLRCIHQLVASEINFRTWQGEHARTCESQLIYITTARFGPIQFKIQSVGADEISQFIPDKMPQFVGRWWAWVEGPICLKRKSVMRSTNGPNHLTWQTPTTTEIKIPAS